MRTLSRMVRCSYKAVVVVTRTRHLFQERVRQDYFTIFLPLVAHWRWYVILLMTRHTLSVSLA